MILFHCSPLLATGVTPIDRWALAKRFGIAVLIGILGANLLVVSTLGMRTDLVQVSATATFWAKIAFPLSLIIWALRGLAPTRLALIGASGGLLAGSMATLAYCLHFPEMEVPFWGVWYTLGMLVPTAIGAALGPRCLRR